MASETEFQAARLPTDDVVIAFRTDKSKISGWLVRLGQTADSILAAHNAPEPASEVLAEALCVASLMGTALKSDGKFLLQSRTDGVVTFLVADYEVPGQLRGYVRYDKAKITELDGARKNAGQAVVLGNGHLGFLLEQGSQPERYQGVVAMDGGTLTDGTLRYFEDSAGIAAFVRLAVARDFKAGDGGQAARWHWRAGGMILQHLGADRSNMAPGRPAGADDEDWVRVRTLAETVEDLELLDPTLTPERLLLRLFHEEGVRIERAQPLKRFCRCSRERVYDVLRSFGAKELSDMHDEQGKITVTCEFCTTTYAFDPAEIGTSEEHGVPR